MQGIDSKVDSKQSRVDSKRDTKQNIESKSNFSQNISNIKTNPKQDLMIFASIIALACVIWAYDIKLYGDIFRFLPIYLGLFMLYQRQFRRILILILCGFIVVCLVFLLKKIFGYLALHYASVFNGLFEFMAKRPINGELSGFPSGHTAPAFLALGFAMNYYSRKWVFLFFILALFVPISRVITLWHTPLQVVVGTLLGLLLGYEITRFLRKFLDR